MDTTTTPAFATLTLAPAIDCTLVLNRALEPGALHLAVEESARPGGKGINVAKVLAARGFPVAAGGLLGQENAAPFVRLLAEMNIRDRFMRVPGETRRNLMLVHDGVEYKINRPAFPGLRYEEAFIRGTIIQLVAGADVVILSGSLPASFPADTYARIVRVLRTMGKAVVLDASGEPFREGVLSKPALIKPNRVEAEELLGRALDNPEALRAACAELAAQHEAVILSDGARGAWFAQGRRLYHATAPTVNVVDTTAAGDMMLAEFCTGFFPGMRLTPELAARAAAAGAAAVEKLETVCPSRARVDQLAALSTVTEHPPA